MRNDAAGMVGHEFDGGPLTVGRIEELARGPVRGSLSGSVRARVQEGRDIVDRALATGAPIYGATTGIGSQKEVAVTPELLSRFSRRMIVSEATDYPGPAFAEGTVRAALAVLINNCATGWCGVRPELIDALLKLLEASPLPPVRRNTAFGAADLTPLSQLSLAVLGRSLQEPGTRAGIELAPKESVSLIDNNSFSLAGAALVLAETERLLATFDLAAASACEGFRVGLEPHALVGGRPRRSPGESRAQAALAGFLRGSALHEVGAKRFLQDPLSFRAITQVHGAAYEAWSWAKTQVEAEINAPTDNPLVDFASRTLQPSASMISVLPTLALDTLRQALGKLVVVSHERSLKLQSPPFSGLPVGLSAPGAADGGILSINLHYIGAARLAELTSLAQPVLMHYIGHMADGVEDVSTQLPLSVEQTERLIERAWELATLELTVAVWAIARRGLPLGSLGRGPRAAVETLLPLLHIGEEGERVFDMSAIVSEVRDPGLLRRASQ